jgi:haloalkane dehalogenase
MDARADCEQSLEIAGDRTMSKWLTRLLIAVVTLGVAGYFAYPYGVYLLPAMSPKVAAEANISPAFPFEVKTVATLDSTMTYVESGEGAPVVFVHGNPTSSYLWRNVIPTVARDHRAIAVDLIGMGKSGKPAIGYTLDEHIRYFDAFMEQMNLSGVVLVLHDWGGPVGIDWAMRHQDQVKGIVVMETILKPMRWADMGMLGSYIFGQFRDPPRGDRLVINENYFVDKLLPMMAGRTMSDEEMAAYRAPYLNEADRKPVAIWPREIPLDGEPARNVTRIGHNLELLQQSQVPLLLLTAEPGVIIGADMLASLKRDLPRMTVRSIGPGLHFIQEAQPTNIANAVEEWTKALP